MGGRRLAVTVALVAWLGVACADGAGDADDAADDTTASSAPESESSATTVLSLPDAICGSVNESSPAVFDDAAGTYAAHATTVSAADRTITFDIVQWLVGVDANTAYEAETGDPSGAPNDYFVVNESVQERSTIVRADAEVWLSGLRGGSGNVDVPFRADFEQLVAAAGEPFAQPFWLTFGGGEIVGVCEQYTP